MPQMMPMNWILIFLFYLSIFMFIVSSLFFSFSFKKIDKTNPKSKMNKSIFIMSW